MNLAWVLVCVFILIIGFKFRTYGERKTPWYFSLTCFKEKGEWYRVTWIGEREKLGKYKNDPTDEEGKIKWNE